MRGTWSHSSAPPPSPRAAGSTSLPGTATPNGCDPRDGRRPLMCARCACRCHHHHQQHDQQQQQQQEQQSISSRNSGRECRESVSSLGSLSSSSLSSSSLSSSSLSSSSGSGSSGGGWAAAAAAGWAAAAVGWWAAPPAVTPSPPSRLAATLSPPSSPSRRQLGGWLGVPWVHRGSQSPVLQAVHDSFDRSSESGELPP